MGCVGIYDGIPSGNDCYIAIEAMAQTKVREFSHRKWWIFPQSCQRLQEGSWSFRVRHQTSQELE